MELSGWTLALQVVNFLVLAWLLQRVLYRPVKQVIAARKQRTEEALDEARRREEEAEAEKTRLAEVRAELERDRARYRREVEEQVEAERRQTRDAASEEARRIVEEGKAALETERRQALDDLKAEIAGLASAMAASLLRALGPAASPATAFAAILAHLESLPASERDAWGAGAGDRPLEAAITTAQPVPADMQVDWRERLAACLGCEVGMLFEVDPEILGGVDLRLPHHRIGLGWAEQLAAAERDLVHHDHAA